MLMRALFFFAVALFVLTLFGATLFVLMPAPAQLVEMKTVVVPMRFGSPDSVPVMFRDGPSAKLVLVEVDD